MADSVIRVTAYLCTLYLYKRLNRPYTKRYVHWCKRRLCNKESWLSAYQLSWFENVSVLLGIGL